MSEFDEVIIPQIVIRPATLADAEGVADVFISSRRDFLPYLREVHSDDEVRRWMSRKVIPDGGVSVATDGDRIVGMMVLARTAEAGWIEHLYLHPDAVGKGLGTQFVARAKAELGAPIRLYTFQANEGARRFYERHGFVAIDFNDGSRNEEGCADVLYEWLG